MPFCGIDGGTCWMKVYNKLVRDRIPDIIRADGKCCVTRVSAPDEFLRMADAKLKEELNEYLASGDIEELADLLEVIHAVAGARGLSFEEVENLRLRKAEERGGFEKQLILVNVSEAGE